MEVSNHNNKKRKNHTPEGKFRHDLELCTKHRDLTTAMTLYDSALSNQIRLNHYHFNALLYICSEALVDHSKQSIAAFEFGFRVFEHMISNEVKPTEATITAVARLAGAKGDGDLAFELVKSMEKYGASPRLRSYNPVLVCYCRNLHVDKAYQVENHMALKGVVLEEQEIGALLKASAEVGRGDRVYEYLHKMREKVRCVSPSTAEIMENWFGGDIAAGLGDVNWDDGRVREAVLANGGGWHGLGWLGKGKWIVRRGQVDETGVCLCCGEQLACVDIDRAETEKFAHSVAALAMEREVESNFKDFQDWLDKHADYEAVVDGANVGLYQQNFADGGFSLSQSSLRPW